MQKCIHEILVSLVISEVGQVAQAARHLATGWMAWVQSQVSKGWRFFFTPSCPDWPWGSLNSYKMSTREFLQG